MSEEVKTIPALTCTIRKPNTELKDKELDQTSTRNELVPNAEPARIEISQTETSGDLEKPETTNVEPARVEISRAETTVVLKEPETKAEISTTETTIKIEEPDTENPEVKKTTIFKKIEYSIQSKRIHPQPNPNVPTVPAPKKHYEDCCCDFSNCNCKCGCYCCCKIIAIFFGLIMLIGTIIAVTQESWITAVPCLIIFLVAICCCGCCQHFHNKQ